MIDRRNFSRRLRRFYLRYHRALAAVLSGAAVFLFARAAAPPPADTVSVVVAAHDLSGGADLQPGDVSLVHLPPNVTADGTYSSLATVIGHTVAAPMRAGEPLTDRRLLGRSLLAGYGTGLVAAAVPIQNPDVVALLHPGDAIDVYAARSTVGPATLLASAAPVVTLPQSTGDTEQGGLVLLAVTPAQAASLASASATSPLFIALRG